MVNGINALERYRHTLRVGFLLSILCTNSDTNCIPRTNVHVHGGILWFSRYAAASAHTSSFLQ